MITTKENIIQYFQKGIKNKDNLKIGVEHEKFIFNKSRKRADFQDYKIKYLIYLKILVGVQFLKKMI